VFLRILILGAAVASAGCNDTVKRVCMGGSGQSSLVTDATMVRLDIFADPPAHCVDNALGAGSGAPVMSHTFAKGQPIALDVPPGKYAIVLTTWADEAGTVALGEACTEADLFAGSEICFDLTLWVPPDLNAIMCTVTPNSCPKGYYCDGTNCQNGCGADTDCQTAGDGGVSGTPFCDPSSHRCVECSTTGQCPGGTICSGNICVPGCTTGQKLCGRTCISDTSCCTAGDCLTPPTPGACYAGACATVGGACSYALKSGAQVCGGTTCCLPINGTCNANCTLSCQSGWADCDMDPVNGCETSLNTTSDCGGCGRSCLTTNVATAQCTNGLCTSSCNAGYGNCSKPVAPTADDGCETNLNLDMDNCGACGRACSGTNVAMRQCSSGLCTSTCNGGWGNCTQPPAPTADNGCETNTTNDPLHCGSCSSCPVPANASATCSSSMCGMSCNSGYTNCDASSSSGCECRTDAAAPACCGTGCQTVHNNGWGGNYFDCSPLGQPGVSGTYTSQMGNLAAFSYTAQSGTPSGGWTCGSGNNTTKSICKPSTTDQTCTCWVWDGTGTYANRIGHTYRSSGMGSDKGCLCPFATDPMWN
jgi:hypothetical protein